MKQVVLQSLILHIEHRKRLGVAWAFLLHLQTVVAPTLFQA